MFPIVFLCIDECLHVVLFNTHVEIVYSNMYVNFKCAFESEFVKT